MKATIAEAHPAVSKIRIEYADGSHDDMEKIEIAIINQYREFRP